MDFPFLTPDEAFLLAAEAAPGLNRESFLEQVRGHIGRGSLLASGFKFWVKKMRLFAPITQASHDLISSDPVAFENASRERVEIPPFAMADYRGPGYDGRIARDIGPDIDGWQDVRLRADDVGRLWPRAAPRAIAATDAGQIKRRRGPKPAVTERVKAAMRDYTADNISDMKLVQMVAEFHASPDTCRRARDAILSEK